MTGERGGVCEESEGQPPGPILVNGCGDYCHSTNTRRAGEVPPDLGPTSLPRTKPFVLPGLLESGTLVLATGAGLILKDPQGVGVLGTWTDASNQYGPSRFYTCPPRVLGWMHSSVT